MTRPRQSIFRFRRHGTLVAADAPMHLEWLAGFLAPYFTLSHDGTADWRVTFSAAADRYERLHAQGAHPSGDLIPFFALDSRLVELPRWSGPPGDELVVFDEEFQVFYGVRRHSHEVFVLASSPRLWTRVALMRVVRELAMEASARDGAFCVHAAAFEVGGSVFLIAGPKHAGKTTLLIHALTSERTRLVANDRVIVSKEIAGFSAHGMPTLVSIRPGTRRLLGGVLGTAEWAADQACLADGEADQYAGRPLGRDERMILSPDQFSRMLGKTQVAAGRLAAIVFPFVDPRGHGLPLTRMTASEASGHLCSSMFRARSQRKVAGTFAGPQPAGEADEDRFRRELVREIPMLRCSLGPRAYPGPTGGRSFVEELTQWQPA